MSSDPFQNLARDPYADMSNLPPAEGPTPEATGDRSGGESSSRTSKSPLHFGLGFLKGLSGDKKTNRDGQPPKRRGPKPDTKPALTRRQELNRQAQRTHRERKEGYIKSLEQQVMQLKEVYTGSVQEKNAFEDENKKLKELLRLHGIAYSGQEQGTPGVYPGNPASRSGSQSAVSYGYGHNQGLSSPPNTLQTHGSPPSAFGGSDIFSNHPSLQQQSTSHHGQGTTQPHQHQPRPEEPLDYDQLGVDFVLALEAACNDHLQYMCVRSNQDPEPTPSGHAAMLSCPQLSDINDQPHVPHPQKSMAIPNRDLVRLLELSDQLPLNGEITPVMALNIIWKHPRFAELTKADFEQLKVELRSKTACYGFGAVLEEFELRDAMSSVLSTKLESYSIFQ